MLKKNHADVVLRGGRISTLSDTPGVPGEVSALAVRSGRVLAVGADDELATFIGPETSVVELGGRRVVPGLVDSHVHFIRAARTWGDEVRWEDCDTLSGALAAVGDRAGRIAEGEWIRVVGGWADAQFAEGRGPTREELDAVAPAHPVFVQAGYDYAVLNSAAIAALGMDEAKIAGSPTPDKFERDVDGQWTGRGDGGMAQLSWFYGQLPVPSLEQQVESTALLSREFARLGLVGATDGGGVNSGPDTYDGIYETWRRGELRTRIRMFKHATSRGTEHEDFGGYLRFGQPRFGDDLLRWSGLGEVILYRSHDGFDYAGDSSPEALAEAKEILLPCAEKGWTIQIHVFQRDFFEALLGLLEEIHAEVPIDALRWSFVHATPLVPEDVPRLKRLSVGVLVQSVSRFNGEAFVRAWGDDRVACTPALRDVLDGGVPLGLGSDGMRASSYNPWASMQHFITGLTVGGIPTLRGAHLLSREEALAGYTRDTAWFTSEEHERGVLAPGFLADLAVLSDDYFTVSVEEIPRITSELTMLSGDVVWSAGAVEATRRRP